MIEDRREIEKLIETTVERTLARLGLAVGDIHEAQRDFVWLRDMRRSTETVKRQGLLTATAALVAAGLAWIGLHLRGGQ